MQQHKFCADVDTDTMQQHKFYACLDTDTLQQHKFRADIDTDTMQQHEFRADIDTDTMQQHEFYVVVQTRCTSCVSHSSCCRWTCRVLTSRTRCPSESSSATLAARPSTSMMSSRDISTTTYTWWGTSHPKYEHPPYQRGHASPQYEL